MKLVLLFLAAAATLDESIILPSDHPAIRYVEGTLTDRATQFDTRLRTGAETLTYNRDSGYLVSLLRAFDIPVASQVLVFSKTSFQAPRIAPRMPRAIYHSPDVSIGFVQGGDVLEIAAVDPRQGTVFYTLDQEESAHPRLLRREECMHCHYGASTLGVPGLIVRSVHTDRNGQALLSEKSYVTDHRSPLEQRWGGWYVTGLSDAQKHMGNHVPLETLIDTGAYLAPTSDVVSLMVLEHQTRFVNLVTRLGWEHRMNRDTAPAMDALVRYMLFEDEAPLTTPIKGSRAFIEAFATGARRDRRGRSLRDFDLTTRLFKYRCSYMIYSDQFQALPALLRDQLKQRILSTVEPATAEILGETL